MTERLQGRTAIVTGAARGIGLAIAQRLGGEGANVVVGDIDECVARDAFAGSDFPHLVQRLDVSRETDAADLVATAEERFGCVDIVVNNAAILDTTPYDELTMDVFRQVLSVNRDG